MAELSIRHRADEAVEPAFSRMPVELLTMIVNCMEGEHKGYARSRWHICEDLRNLRSASRQFAYVPYLLSITFRGIKLQASPEKVKQLDDQASLERLKPYVKAITFDACMDSPDETLELCKNGKIQETWTRTLKQLPNATEFGIRQSEPDEDRKAHERVGEAVFGAATSSLRAAETAITALDINHVADPTTWSMTSHLEGLRLKNLQRLHYKPQIPEHEHGQDEIFAPRNTKNQTALIALLRRCNRSLEDLRLELPFGYSFPPSDAPAMTSLKKFYTDSRLELYNFINFISNASRLSHLHLFSCGTHNGQLEPFVELFKAIRYHPSRMRLDFDELPCVDWTELGVHHHTGKKSTSRRSDDPMDDINYSLEMYMSKRGKWNRSCRVWFNEIGEDDEYTDNSSGEDGEGKGVEDRSDDEDDDEDEGGDGDEDGSDGDGDEEEDQDQEDEDDENEGNGQEDGDDQMNDADDETRPEDDDWKGENEEWLELGFEEGGTLVQKNLK